MREIRFRVWVKALKRMSNLIEFYCGGGALAGDYEYPLDKNDIEVMQYTGLKDKNGVEIYEGDIVIQHCEWVGGYGSDEFGENESFGVVKIYPSKGAVITRAKRRDIIECDDKWVKCHDLNLRSYRVRVVGNIHENPELLK